METQRLAQAQAAVRAIGAQRALPTLLSLLKTKDSPIRAWLADKTKRVPHARQDQVVSHAIAVLAFSH